VVIAGEVRGPASITNDMIESATREAIKDIGYDQEGFSWKTADIEILLHAQSADIALASMPPATRMRARATRASCSAMPAARPRR